MPASVHSEEPQEHDQSMMDAENEPVNPILLDEKRIVVLPGSSETAASFQFEGEGHTMGNALRFAIMKNPSVEFCGYTIPHPSDAKMHLRIQTTDSTTALEALEKGFSDLMDLCDVVTDKFTVARDQFNQDNSNRMQS
ncbi:DNA-directed RNA polymerase I and III subunit [Penicillium macrosclerotiorum]|uniref:DNA-directed RNA polymerase I and III subunit n=1 Tax=Penicillium macrosclerotiorum TaxID=303699 RepID=UPI002547A21C|nr:DNA-directed RNA polymerase I and III subunit [Penicillium macrosclerotiorum]KAJ5669261.1 DNA-directed RNA polymerase I and III subunit [Penicillium macrosclerotiorum]